MILVVHKALLDGPKTPESAEFAEMLEAQKFEGRASSTSPDSEFRLGEHNGAIVRTTDIAVSSKVFRTVP